jgi:hypothetical protein
MTIIQIIDNTVTATRTLPTACIIANTSHAVQTLSRWQELHPGEDWRETAVITPIYDPATHRLVDDFDPVTGLLLTVAIPVEEIAAAIATLRKEAIRQISRAAKDAVEDEANAALQIQMERNYVSATPHLMIVEIINWGKSIYMQAEVNKSMVAAGMADDGDFASLCDFSAFGPKPYTVYQLYVAGLVEL